jgi:hypothetical protein
MCFEQLGDSFGFVTFCTFRENCSTISSTRRSLLESPLDITGTELHIPAPFECIGLLATTQANCD